MRQPLTLALPRPARTVVADCLKPQGRVFFADDAYRTPDELVEGPSSPVIRRQLNDGTPYRLVKVPHQPASLQEQLKRIGWSITVTPPPGRCRSTGEREAEADWLPRHGG